MLYRRILSLWLLSAVLQISAQTVTRYEYWLGSDYSNHATVVSSAESINVALSTDGLANGLHVLNFRVQNSEGDWSSIQRMLFVIPPLSETSATLTDWEWWLDNDRESINRGNGNHEKMVFTCDISSLSVGLHCVNYRVRNSHGDWSPISRYLFIKPEEPENPAQMTDVEYWLDEDYSKVFRMSSQMDSYSISMDISSLNVGVHTMNFRAKNSNGEWSPTSRYLFYVPDAPEETDSPYTGYYYAFNNQVKYESIGERKEYEMKNQVFAIPDLLEIGDVGPGCSFVIDKQNNNVTLNRAQDVSFSLWFSKKDGTSSFPVRTTFEMSDKQTREISLLPIGLNKTVDKLSSGDFIALSFDVLLTQNLEFLTSSPCMVRLFNSEGNMLSAITVGERWQFPISAGSFYMVISNSTIAKESLDDQLTIALRPANMIPDEGDDLQAYLNSLYDTQDVLSGNLYTRQFLNTDWQALYVPFSLSYSDWSDKFDVASLSRFCQYDEDDNGEVDRQELEAVILRSNSETLKANTPYLIRAKKAGTYNFTVNSSNQVAEETNSFTYSASGAKMVITGNYANQSGLKSASRYRLMGGSLFIPTQDDEVLPPYRWYATINSQDKAKVRIKFVDDATGIEMMSVDNEESIGDRRIYDLSGRRINVREGVRFSSLPKGVYIINNKKYIIK